MNSILVSAPAKINLYLDVTSKRQDGYHNILSIMQSVSLCDEVFIERSNDVGIQLICEGENVPLGNENIAYRAAELFLKTAMLADGVKISLRKSIPMAAGLAGGSADAAAVLRGLNRMFSNPFSTEGLCKMAASLGADVPFCVRGGCMKAEGIGDVLSELPTLSNCNVVISCPNKRESTPAAYAALDRMYNNFENYSGNELLYYRAEAALCEKNVEGVCRNLYNVFESINQHREDITELKRMMLEAGADGAMMSGSGPSVFGIFKDAQAAQMAVVRLEQRGYIAYNCTPVQKFAI